jgi:hypothetical protein
VDVLTRISGWFAPTAAPEPYKKTDYVLLLLILAIGVFVRFWGLGDFSLHGDERHMATPAMAILETGEPILPSGMFYSRALGQIYLMAGSVWLFGESEWAFRLPSAIVGSLTGLFAFFLGRRFLSPQFNIAFVATITFLPAMIAISQHARMYVFLLTCLIWFGACIFRWERDQRLSSLALAFFAWLLALHFQQLAVLAAPLFFYPGLSRGSWKHIAQGGVALVAAAASFKVYEGWMARKFSDNFDRLGPAPEEVARDPMQLVAGSLEWFLLAATLLVAGMFAVFFARFARKSGWQGAVPVLMVGAGLVGMLMFHYHIGVILLALGAVFWWRQAALPRLWLLGALGLAAIIAVSHGAWLYTTGAYPGRKLIGALIGMPSVWPALKFFQYSPFAAVFYGLALVAALLRFAEGRRLPVHFLFFLLAVWGPLFVLGFLTWYMPPRYAQGQLAYFLLCTFAGLAYVGSLLGQGREGARASRPMAAALVLACVLMINPFALARTVNPDFSSYPDHKGAAEYIMAVDPERKAVLIAEDATHQTYYLGKVDYWLREFNDVRKFAFVRDGRILDVYTGAEIIGTGAELEAILEANAERTVYIIGSGENFVNGVRGLRGEGIAEVLASPGLEVVYEGRDGNTKVWRPRSP